MSVATELPQVRTRSLHSPTIRYKEIAGNKSTDVIYDIQRMSLFDKGTTHKRDLAFWDLSLVVIKVAGRTYFVRQLYFFSVCFAGKGSWPIF